jgi:hypothetical protein
VDVLWVIIPLELDIILQELVIITSVITMQLYARILLCFLTEKLHAADVIVPMSPTMASTAERVVTIATVWTAVQEFVLISWLTRNTAGIAPMLAPQVLPAHLEFVATFEMLLFPK